MPNWLRSSSREPGFRDLALPLNPLWNFRFVHMRGGTVLVRKMPVSGLEILPYEHFIHWWLGFHCTMMYVTTEMPTSGDLKSGDSLFCIPPSPQISTAQLKSYKRIIVTVTILFFLIRKSNISLPLFFGCFCSKVTNSLSLFTDNKINIFCYFLWNIF